HINRQMTFKVLGPRSNSVTAWEELIGKLKNFRQLRNPGTGRIPGRSLWPEPDAIRRLSTSAPKHSVPLSMTQKFPRAAFGLPIIFQFKRDDVKAGDPPVTTLQGRDVQRLASPLILRPLACDGGQALGLAAVLESPRIPPGGLVLDGIAGRPGVVSDLVATEAVA